MLRVFAFEHRVFSVRRRSVRRGIIVDQLAPAFPGYVFIAACECWDFISEIIGVIGFIKHDGLDDTVAELDQQATVTERDHVLSWTEEQSVPARFAVGDRVRVLTGSVCGYRGVYQQPLSHQRALILLDWMGRMVPVSLDERELASLEVVPTTRSRPKRRRPHRSRRRAKEVIQAPALMSAT
jgi:transcription antitermination factor NusG